MSTGQPKDANNFPQVAQYMDMDMQIASSMTGNITKVNKFGRNYAVGTAVEDIWNGGGVYAWPTAAAAVGFISTNVADKDNTTTGTGIRKVFVEGLLAGGTLASETISMLGSTATAASSNSYSRVFRFYGTETGTYDGTTMGSQAGTITCTLGGVLQGYMNIDNTMGLNQSEIARYTVPKGKTAYVRGVTINVDAAQAATVYMFQRQNALDFTTPFTPKRLVDSWDGIKSPVRNGFNPPNKFPELTDIWFSAVAGAGSTAIDVSFDIILVDD